MAAVPGLTLSELVVPERIGGAASAVFEELVAMVNGISVELWGNHDFVYSAEAELPAFRPQGFLERITFFARLDGIMVGRVIAEFPLEPDAVTATLLVDVVPAARGRGIGSALLAKGEELVADGGRTTISTYTEYPAASLRAGSPLIRPDVGPSGVPADSPDTRFALSHGYRLGQIERSSELPLPMPADRLAALEAEATGAAGSDYRVLGWWRHAPDEFVAGFADLRARMTRDVPQSGIALDDEEWTPARVRELEQLMIDRGEPFLCTVAQHVPTGRLVAYTDLVVPEGGGKVEQHDTLVVKEHRGHRLGMLVKAENIRRLAELDPAATRI
ncbi:MAG TPA: GNAT family N-acetyltransferase, partial [Diaminobutyricibacter sp.]